MNWTNPLYTVITNAEIVEYDIRQGNTSIMKEFGYAPDDVIDYLKSLGKEERNVRVGLMQRENPKFAVDLEAGFDEMAERFMKENELDQMADVLAIRKDAIFVINKHVKTQKIGPYVQYVKKNTFHAFIRIGEKLEMYFYRDPKKGKTFDIDHFIRHGAEYDHVVGKLTPGILSFIDELISVMEGSNNNRRIVYKFIADFCKLYKERELDIEYYREFSREAKFRLISGDGTMTLDYVEEDYMDDLDIRHNYVNVIIPVIQSII